MSLFRRVDRAVTLLMSFGWPAIAIYVFTAWWNAEPLPFIIVPALVSTCLDAGWRCAVTFQTNRLRRAL